MARTWFKELSATLSVPEALRVAPEQLGSRVMARLFAPVDIAPLVFFRIAFGAILLFQSWAYAASGTITEHWIEPQLHFTYFGFGWVKPWPGDGMYIHFSVLAAASACIMLGLWYRLAAAVFFVGFTYTFLLEQAVYLNHFYLVILISFLLIFIPANRAFSLDAKLKPKIRSETAPAWALYILLVQIGIVYFYAGIAKLNPDWLQGEPMRTWLASRADDPLFGGFFTHSSAAYFFSYGGLMLDLLVVFFLLYPPTRLIALGFAISFHLMNFYLFNIGIFPWFMIAATMLFFPAHWFRLRGRFGRSPVREAVPAGNPHGLRLSRGQLAIAGFLAVYVTFQILFPFRHVFYPGNPSWTEEGHRFAWHMLLRGKSADAEFTVVHPESGQSWTIDNSEYLTHRQERKMATRQDMIIQFAHHLARDFEKRGHEGVEVYADVQASLNAREYQYLVDPEVNLAAEKRSLRPASWIVPLGH